MPLTRRISSPPGRRESHWPRIASAATPCCGTSPVLGEGSRAAPDDLKADQPEIPWLQPARLRNRIVHGSWSIDLDILITTATERLPAMVDDLRNAREALDQP
jgi:uncharacterized protein with HEPN domain